MLALNVKDLKPAERQNILQHAIAPRPICFASTIDKNGNVNLSPFSFFNLFSSNPPIVIFSPARRVRDNTTKHTLENILEVPEVVVNICDYNMVQQVSLSSCDYPKGIDEFIKAGFTKEPSRLIQPPRVKESPVQMECNVIEIKPLGTEGGAGNLVIAEVLLMHINEAVLNEDKTMIDQTKLQHIARLGGDWYCKVNSSNLFKVEKPNTKLGIGIDMLPASIRNSTILTGNNLGQLANVHEMPVIDPAFDDDRLKNIIQYFSINPNEMEKELHTYAKELLNSGNVNAAWQVLLCLG
ncbi:MAG TPA: flavin reductase family protein [Ferruginibacter sp.]|nr:flavin reductase family protein [Ferruginibacter sp.]HMP20620.1 flavin reductase family protein [Ferruginibacter sp.]